MSQLHWLTGLAEQLKTGLALLKIDRQEAGFVLLEGVLSEIDGERETLMRMEEDDE